MPPAEPLDEDLISAIREAVESAGLPEKVAQRLMAWIGEASVGRADLSDPNENKRRFELLREAILESEGGGAS
jgi:hypothetical protein